MKGEEYTPGIEGGARERDFCSLACLLPSFPPSFPPSLSTKSGGTLPSCFAFSSVAATAT